MCELVGHVLEALPGEEVGLNVEALQEPLEERRGGRDPAAAQIPARLHVHLGHAEESQVRGSLEDQIVSTCFFRILN